MSSKVCSGEVRPCTGTAVSSQEDHESEKYDILAFEAATTVEVLVGCSKSDCEHFVYVPGAVSFRPKYLQLSV